MTTTVVVFGNQRHGAIYALRKGIDPSTIIIATKGAPAFHGVVGPITVVRVPEEVWKPTTFACENRVRETEAEIKRILHSGEEVTEVMLT